MNATNKTNHTTKLGIAGSLLERRSRGVIVLDCRGLEGTLGRTHCILLLTGDCDDSTASWHLEDIVAVMSHGHELGQSWVPEDGIVRQADVGDVEVNDLGAVVVALPEGNRKADLPYWNSGTISDS